MASPQYLDKKEDWQRVASYIEANETEIGLDSEFDGVDFDAGESCYGRARIHVWSLALYDGGYSPRGYRTSRGICLPSAAIPTFASVLENAGIRKYAHNSNVDVHAFGNSGVDVVGVINTLSLARWIIPGRLKYGLDILGEELLGFGKFCSFDEVCSRPKLVERTVKECSCGVDGCRKRKGHTKIERQVIVPDEKAREPIPLRDVVPGHEQFDLLVKYAIQDAEAALCLADYLNYEAKQQEIYIPWIQN